MNTIRAFKIIVDGPLKDRNEFVRQLGQLGITGIVSHGPQTSFIEGSEILSEPRLDLVRSLANSLRLVPTFILSGRPASSPSSR